MKTIMVMTILSVAMLSSGVNAAWYHGGNLKEANGYQWRTATHSNRLATAAEFAKVGHKLGWITASISSVNDLRPHAEMIEQCVTEATSDPITDNEEASTFAALCIKTLFD